MKRPRAAAVETADAAGAAVSDAFTALRVARELEEDGDAEAARSCVEHAVGRARDSASAARVPLTFDEASATLSNAARPPAALLASAGLATLAASRRHWRSGQTTRRRAWSSRSSSYTTAARRVRARCARPSQHCLP